MSDGVLSFKKYLLISVLSSLGIFVIGSFFGTQITDGLSHLQGAAMSVGVNSSLVNVVTEPLRAAFSNGLPGAIIAGFLWPISSIWLILAFCLFFFTILAGGMNTAAGTIRR